MLSGLRSLPVTSPSDRSEDRDHIKQAADDAEPYPDGLYLETGADRISGYAWNPQGEK